MLSRLRLDSVLLRSCSLSIPCIVPLRGVVPLLCGTRGLLWWGTLFFWQKFLKSYNADARPQLTPIGGVYLGLCSIPSRNDTGLGGLNKPLSLLRINCNKTHQSQTICTALYDNQQSGTRGLQAMGLGVWLCHREVTHIGVAHTPIPQQRHQFLRATRKDALPPQPPT